MDTNDWCITFTRSIGIVENVGLRPRFSTLPSGPCAMLTQVADPEGAQGIRSRNNVVTQLGPQMELSI